MLGQLKSISREQHDFKSYLNSLGIVKQSTPLRVVMEFKMSAFDYLVHNPFSTNFKVVDFLKLSLEKLNQSYALKQISKREHANTSNGLKKYFQFLTLNGLVSDDWNLFFQSTKPRKPKLSKPNKRENKVFYINGRKKKDFVQNQIFRNYMEKLEKRNASCINEHYNTIAYFLRFLRSSGITSIESLPREYIKEYENHLESRFLLKEIKKKTAYDKLLKLKHFINYLYSISLVSYKYDIPLKFKGSQITRDNEYVTNEDRLRFIEGIVNNKFRNFKRDLATTLIFVDIGCRPIEVCNIKISDVNTTESTLTLYCKKSGQRVLKVDKFVMKHISIYLEYRKKLPAETDHLFLLETGDPMNTKAIGSVINVYNKITFGESRFSAKSLRHTFITNALNDRNDINQVSLSAGHKHLVSTLHYFYRSIETLLENTLAYNPVEGIDQI
ncbi:site-specific integrase [Paenibacillus alginolyticus]|uniref:tyrosine-type recombinase/integrase n=1 Tax=Paenibacillus alginolyticus TaxID=59839 RepID=UPI0003F58E6C|nr:site-specific integrase [Paenibacillus alginolyticus]MCY9670886.1 site-specific integrase [Paenibacillus alginolyticus]